MSQAAPADSTAAPARRDTILGLGIAAADIERRSIPDLIVLHEAYVHAAQAFTAFMNAPRCGGVSKTIEGEWDRLLTISDHIHDEIERRDAGGEHALVRLAFLTRMAVKHENYEQAAHLAATAAIHSAADWARFEAEARSLAKTYVAA